MSKPCWLSAGLFFFLILGWIYLNSLSLCFLQLVIIVLKGIVVRFPHKIVVRIKQELKYLGQ